MSALVAAVLLAPAAHACSFALVPLAPDLGCPQVADELLATPPVSAARASAALLDASVASIMVAKSATNRVRSGAATRIPLREAADAALQAQLEALLADPALARAIREQRFAAALVDLTDPARPRLAQVNGDVMIYAASLPKIAILLGVFEQASAGAIRLDEQTLTQARRMIRNSSNPAATAMYYEVGPQRLAAILRSDRYRLYNREWGGGLWVGKPYARRDTWQRDPLTNLSHGATAFQVARFFYLLETGQLVSPEASAQMKRILGKPAIRHKFVKGLSAARPPAQIYRKSGTWRTYHSDAGIIERGDRRYIAVMLANDPVGGEWLSELIVDFDAVIQAQERQSGDPTRHAAAP